MDQQTEQAPRKRPPLPEWTLSVVEAFDVTPRMRRVVFTGDNLDEMTYRPGQALVLAMPLPEGGTGRRDYTIRSFDRKKRQLAMDFVLHGTTPSPEWARRAAAGDVLQVRGPRGRTVIDETADWHLFCGDETCLPAILHMLESLPENAKVHVFLEVTWVDRGGEEAGPNTLLLDRLAAFELPQGRGHAYIIGETSNVRAQRRHLVERGLEKSQISSEGYWRPGRIGGHDHVDD
jgi:NADPH-dependent ferric siderophore reductase